jgi:hypothetical protein
MAHCYDIILDMSYELWMMTMGNGHTVFNFHATMNDYYKLNFNVVKTNKVPFVSMSNLCFFWDMINLQPSLFGSFSN